MVFDIAGTTLQDDGAVENCLAAALRVGGYTAVSDAIKARMGIPKPVAIAELAPSASPTDVERMHEEFVARMMDYYRHAPEVKPFHGVNAMFGELRNNGVRVALDTGFDRPTTEVILDRCQWRPLVDTTVTSDEVSAGRPAPDLIRLAMERTGVGDPAEVVKVGDTPSDIKSGLAAGCRDSVGVAYGTHSGRQLRNAGATQIFDGVLDLRNWLRRTLLQ